MHRFTELLKSSLEFSDRDKEVIKIAETPFLSSFSLPVKFFVNGAKKSIPIFRNCEDERK